MALIVLLILGSFCVNMVKGTFFPKGPVSIGIAVSGLLRVPGLVTELRGGHRLRSEAGISANSGVPALQYRTGRFCDKIHSLAHCRTAGHFHRGQCRIRISPFSGYSGRSVPDCQRNCGAFCRTRSQSMPSKFPAPPSPENTAFRMSRSTCVCSPMGHGYQRGLDIAAYILENG